MYFAIPDPEFKIEQTVQQETAQDLIDRILAQAAHPSTMGTAPVIREVDIQRGYEQILPGWKYLTDYPRMSIRAIPGLLEGQPMYVASLWFMPGKPVLVNGRQVTRMSARRDELLWWSQRTIEEFKSMNDFFQTGQLGSEQMRWAPQW